MQITPLRLVTDQEPSDAFEQAVAPGGLTVAKLEIYARDWLIDCDYRQHSPKTIDIRRFLLGKLVWFLRAKGFESCGLTELRAFFAYVTNGHNEPSGRWGIAQLKNPVKPRTLHTYHGHLKTFFDWLVAEGSIPSSPMARIAPPIFRADQVQPFTDEQIELLLEAARRTKHRRRDEAIVLLLLDTGMRASELCGLKMSQLDMDGRSARVLGKGNKERTVYFGRITTKAVWAYLREDPRDGDQAVFVGDRGAHAGEGLSRSGLLHLVRRLGKAAGLPQSLWKVHTFRHYAALSMLKAGANAFTVQVMLGHTDLTMTQRYINLANADVQAQHRQFSPADRLRKSR